MRPAGGRSTPAPGGYRGGRDGGRSQPHRCRPPTPVTLLVVARVRRGHFVGVAVPRRVGRVARGELPRREVRARRRDALFELLDVETALGLRVLILLLH